MFRRNCLSKRVLSAVYLGLGGQTYVNDAGDRETDFTLLDQEHVTGEYRVSDVQVKPFRTNAI